MPLATNASRPIIAVRTICSIRLWNCVARSTVTGNWLRSSASSQAYFTR